MELERNLARRGSFRLLRGAVAIGIDPRNCPAINDAVSTADIAASAGQKNAA